MKKTILFRLEELKELLEKTFNCTIRYNNIEKHIENEAINIDIIEIYHNDKNIIDLAFPYAEHKDEHLSIVELSDLHLTLKDLVNEPITESYTITEIDLGQGAEQYVLFDLH